MSTETCYSVCPHDCPSVCALEVERLDEATIGKVNGSKVNPYTDGVICGKVARYRERVHHPERLLHPLKRVGAKGSGEFVEISWDEALETVASAFEKVIASHGSQAIWPYNYAGTMGLLQRDGLNRLRNGLGTSLQKNTICAHASGTGWKAGMGIARGVDCREMSKSEVIVIWGTNAVSTQIHVMSEALKGKANGAKLVVVDPYRTKTAEKADLHIPVRPGTDGALVCALMHVLFRDGLVDRAYLGKYTDCPDQLEAHVKDRSPKWASAITGLDVEVIEQFAKLYGSTKKSFIRVGFGMTRTRNGAANIHAVSCLPALTGAWGQEGGGALYTHGGLFAAMNASLIEGSDLAKPGRRVLDMSRIGPVLCGDPRDLGDGPPVLAMIIQNTNPMAVAPELAKVHRGFAREDLFVCVHEQFMTETAKMADIVLPATMFLEHHDFYRAGGHPFLQVSKPIIKAPGQCRSNHAVVSALGKRLGLTHPGFELSEFEIIDQSLTKSGLPGFEAIYQARGLDMSNSFEDMHFLNGFPTPDGKFRFAPDWASLGDKDGKMPKLPDHLAVIEAPSAEKPFRLVTAPAQNFLNTSFTEMASSRKKEQRPEARLCTSDAEKLGLADGDLVRLGNERGDLLIHVKVVEGQQAGVCVVESIWPNAAFVEGVGINVLTSAEPGFPDGGAVFHDTSIWIKSA